jgi:hypothetical protein
MNAFRKFAVKFLVVAMVAALCQMTLHHTRAQAQVQSNVQTIALNLTIGESITLSAPSPATITFSPTTGLGTTTSNITVTWNLATDHSQYNLYAYFSSASALTSGSNVIPTSALESNWGSGGTPCNTAITFTTTEIPNGCAVTSFTSSTQLQGSNTFAFGLWIPGYTPTMFPVGTYTGTVNIAAIAI